MTELLSTDVLTPTNAGRRELDYYPTPGGVIRSILPHLPQSQVVLDPCCGIGEILAEFGHDVARYGIELDNRRASSARENFTVETGDALARDWPVADLCIFNPPFVKAQEFAEKAVAWRGPRCTVAMLARLTFLESAERAPFHKAHPSDVYVLSKRPKFRSDRKGTDSVTVAWFVFGPGRGGRWSVL